MSSIFGVLEKKSTIIQQDTVGTISNITGWWKPTHSFSFVNKHVMLGQQNMLVTSTKLEDSNQWISQYDGLYIVSDARIDNRDELKELTSSKTQISTNELLLKLYLRFGESCVEYIVGAFTFAIWDKKNDVIFIARDQLGVKPLVYYFKDGRLAFGTQKKSILALENINNAPNWRYILNSFSSLGVEAQTTEYQYIKQLAPGHYIKFKDGDFTIKKYWELDIHKESNGKSLDDHVEEFIHLFKQAITCRMNPMGATATHLSGGLDSSGITSLTHSLATKNKWDQKILSYNILENYKEEHKSKFEENLMAFELIKHLEVDHLFTNVNTPIARSLYEKVCFETQSCDGRSRSNNVNTEYEIQAEAHKQNAQVLLSGFPGDELVTSFCRPFYLEHFDKGHWIKYFLDKKKSRHTFNNRMSAFFPALLVKLFPPMNNILGKQYSKRRYKDHKYRSDSIFLNQDFFNSSEDRKQFLDVRHFPFAHSEFPSSLKQYQRNHICRSHTNRRIESEVLAGKAWHVEYRYPLADIRLIQFMISLPMEHKISDDMSRRIFRLGMKNYLPDSIRLRDIKRAGSLKPMATINYNPHKKEVLDFVQELKTSNKAPFLNLETMEKWIKSKNSVYKLYNWLILAQLGYKGKINYTSK